ncbi:MAG: hypothetical protein KGZ79_05060 [Dethiobacter sp.]|jgi:hypothetical protein|nr:hypothetical protein [Dethiobacter sp.]
MRPPDIGYRRDDFSGHTKAPEELVHSNLVGERNYLGSLKLMKPSSAGKKMTVSAGAAQKTKPLWLLRLSFLREKTSWGAFV